MKIEYYINSIDDKDIDIKENIDKAVQFNIDSLLCSIHNIRLVKKNFNINCGVFIDYPLSFNDFNYRKDSIANAIDCGANFVAITTPFQLIINRKYTKFREDIVNNLTLCKNHNIDIRYILEYRKFDHTLLQKVCDILKECGIERVYPSTGLFMDNIEDNIIACSYLKQKTGIDTIINGNIWNKSHIGSIQKNKPSMVSTNQIESLYLLQKYGI